MKYDWRDFHFYVNWAAGNVQTGALRLGGHHHICALMSTSQPFTTEAYEKRLAMRGQTRYDAYGTPLRIVWEKMDSIEELMKLDMDHILSCIHCSHGPQPQGWAVELFTNDRENPQWLEFLKECPYAKMVYEIPSRMGLYNVQCWLFRKEFGA